MTMSIHKPLTALATFFKTVIGAFATLFGFKIDGTQEEAEFVGGFQIDNLYDPGNPEGTLLDILESNIGYLEEEPTSAEYVTIGWFIRINHAELNNADNDLKPLDITQLIISRDLDQVYAFEERDLAYRISEDSTSTYEGGYNNHRIFPDHATYYHNFVESNYQELPAEMTSPDGDWLKMQDLDHFKSETEVVFFSRSQLLMLKRIMDMTYQKNRVYDCVFSGYKLRTGRVASLNTMGELEQFKLNGPSSGNDFEEWFSLKVELVERSFLDPEAMDKYQSNLHLEPEYANPDDETNDDASALFRTSVVPDSSTPTGPSTHEEICRSIEAGSIPVINYGAPCPTAWITASAMIDETIGRLGPALDDENLEDLICQMLKLLTPKP